MNFKDLIERHPEVVRDRHALSFTRQSSPAKIAESFSRGGVVMLKEALPSTLLESCAAGYGRFMASPEAKLGAAPARGKRRQAEEANRCAHQCSWHSPWRVRDGAGFPTAAVMSAVIRSWAWDVVEELCGSSHLVVLLKWCMARHGVDTLLGVGGHQDAKVVAADVPFSLWIPFTEIVPGRTSGLGFLVPSPDGLLPTLPNDDIGADYVLSDPERIWIPPYAAGDLTIHSRFSPHFTTGYGTVSDRFSLEMRVMPRLGAPEKYLDPVAYVSRRNGLPTIVETRSSSDDAADEFLASADLAGVMSAGLHKGDRGSIMSMDACSGRTRPQLQGLFSKLAV